jgi:D-serine deaminase-like pyridoxal phosphate-dependent protein
VTSVAGQPARLGRPACPASPGRDDRAGEARLLPLPLDPAADLPVPLGSPALDTPAMLIDLDIVDANLAKMAAFARRAGLRLRPHAKTHKSLAMARRQLAAGAAGLCVATVSEAAALAAAVQAGESPAGEGRAGEGQPDLTLAYPIVGERKLSRLAEVCRDVRVTLVADSTGVIDGYQDLARRLGQTVPVLVEVDTGMNRAGAPARVVPGLARHIAASAGLRFAGILTHAGHAHNATSQRGIEQVARQEAAIMGDVRAELERAGHEVPVVSAGSSLTARYLSAADGITEIRPGTYIYNDLRTLACWSCTAEEMAASMLATVVSVGQSRATVDAGSKTLTTTTDPAAGAGHLAGRPDAVLARTSEEHGVLEVGGPPAFGPGDRVRILPVHVCVWTDLQPEVYGIRGGQVVERIRVDAFRHSL